MDGKEFLQKYGLWIGVAAVVLYALYKGAGSGVRTALTAPTPNGGADFAAQTERLRQVGALDIRRLELESNLEAQRLKAANDRFNLEQQALARNRALDAAQRGQTLGLIGQLANAVANLFKGQQSQSKGSGSSGGSSGGGFPGTPPIFGRTQPRPAPPYAPAVQLPNIFFPSDIPLIAAPAPTDYPLSITDWGEAPQFPGVGMDIDSGATFFDQWGGADFNYGYGMDYGDIYSGQPELTTTEYSDPYDVGAGGDFTYGYGVEGDYGGGDYGGGDSYGYGGDE